MIEPLPTAITDVFAWGVVALFVGSWIMEGYNRDSARLLGAVAWGTFGLFWLSLVPRFAFVMRSPIETTLSVLAVPGCLYAGYLLYSGRDTLFTLTRAVAIMGVVYLPFETIEFLRRVAVESLARQIYLVIQWLGFEVSMRTAEQNGYYSALVFTNDGRPYVTHIVLACTGIGSMTIFAGLVAALKAPLVRKTKAFALAVGIIYVLNVLRNVFIAVAFGRQWFQVFIDPIMWITGYTDPGLVSFFIADRVISQSLSVVALVGITYLVVRIVPELLAVIEEAVYVVTRSEIDLYDALAIDGR